MTEATHNCKVLVSEGVKVRPAPNTSNTATNKLEYGTLFQISEIFPDSLDPANTSKKWGKIFGGQYDGLYTALEYPGNQIPISSYTPIEGTEPPTTIFPESFILTDPATNQSAEYSFVKVIE